jgi:type III pantothenate kinase
VIVSSVVPKATTRLELALRFLKVKNVHILGRDLAVPIKNLYQYPRQVGQDRLVNGYAAARLYGVPAIVVDFGTAITFDIISAQKEYLGGLILPGLETSLSALSEKAALLPKISLAKPPKGLIGRNTKDSMLCGIIFGFASLTDSVTQELKDELLGKNAQVIGTGGNIRFISQYCHNFDSIDQDLTLKGLNLIFQTLATPGKG